MIITKTSAHITEALKDVQRGLENLKIHNKKTAKHLINTENARGEWVLIRSKKENETKSTNIDQAINDLIDKWEKSLQVKKRKHDDEQEPGRSVHRKK